MERKLPPGWRISEEYSESKDSDYVKRMTEELLAIPRLKREVPNTWNGKPIELLTQSEREAFYFSMQQKSTQEAILRQKDRKPEEDIDYLLRPMPECIANPDAKSLDDLVAKRALDPSDINAHNGSKQGRNQLGQSETGSVDSEKRARGIQAFTYSKPADLTPEQEKKLTKLTEIYNTPLKPKLKKEKWWKFWSVDSKPLTKDEFDEYMGRK